MVKSLQQSSPPELPPWAAAWAPLPLRLALGLGMIQAGFPKLFIPLGRANIAHLLAGLGIPFPQGVGWVVGLIEFVGGFGILLGALITIAAILNALSILTLIVLSLIRGGIPQPLAGGDPFPDYPLAILILAGMLTLVLGGAGNLSLSQMIQQIQSGKAK
jgi:putative oxidoreductase